ALIAGGFVVILGLTGSIMAFEEELDHLTHPRLFHVAPTGDAMRLFDLGGRVAAQAGKPVVGYGLSVSPDLAWTASAGGSNYYVNEYTGEILGPRQGPTILGQIHQIHLRLLAGDIGKSIISWAGVLMLFLLVSGFYLWWPVKRIAVNVGAGGAGAGVGPQQPVRHVALPFLLMLCVPRPGHGVGCANADGAVPRAPT